MKLERRSCIECENMSLVYDKIHKAMWNRMWKIITLGVNRNMLHSVSNLNHKSDKLYITLWNYKITLQTQPTDKRYNGGSGEEWGRGFYNDTFIYY